MSDRRSAGNEKSAEIARRLRQGGQRMQEWRGGTQLGHASLVRPREGELR